VISLRDEAQIVNLQNEALFRPGASCYRHQIAARPESERCIHVADMGQTQVAAG